MALTKKDVPSYEELVAENARLHSLLAELQSKVPLPERTEVVLQNGKDQSLLPPPPPPPPPAVQPEHHIPKKKEEELFGAGNLSATQIRRYGRQLLLSEFGQKELLSKSILIVGAGGIGSSVILYLAGAGVRRLTIIDYDRVDIANLHRQVIHSESTVGHSKAESAREAALRLNSTLECVAYSEPITSRNALALVSSHDVVVDACDNAPTRYLVNDACVLSGRPLVSAAALRCEAQLSVYHYKGGPCYRCIFPEPPPAETMGSCSELGVLGVVPGIIGTLAALEAIKIASGVGDVLSGQLLMFDALAGRFRSVRLRSRSPQCVVCGDHPTVTHLIDYEAFCGAPAHDRPVFQPTGSLSPSDSISCAEYEKVRDTKHFLLDVREAVQFDICALPGSVNIPLRELPERLQEVPRDVPVYVICRRGVDSVSAAYLLLARGYTHVKNINGGLLEWATLHPTFPQY